MNLKLPVKKQYFLDIKSGVKKEEYRLANNYWRRRLVGKRFKSVTITLGYPLKEDESKAITFPWQGYEIKTITHPHFGERETVVFAIKLGTA